LDNLEFRDESLREISLGSTLAVHRVGVWHWLVAAVLVQALVLAVIGATTGVRYLTLSSGRPPPALESPIRAVFASTMTLAELRSLLVSHGLMIVRGPSEAGVYTLVATDPHDSAGRLGATMAALRADARVRFVEPAVNDESARQ
jgi:hypothetical protein